MRGAGKRHPGATSRRRRAVATIVLPIAGAAATTPIAGAAAAVVLLIAPAVTPVAAQDTHYWGFENGARATLLGGAVVADDGDLAATFYNPAALTAVTEGQALSLFVKTITDLTLDARASDGFVATSSVGASAPGFFAARLPVHLVEGDVLTFSFVARTSSKLDLGGDVATASATSSEVRDFFIFQDIYDGWYGVSWAVDVESVALGASLFLSNVSYRQRLQHKAVSLDASGGVVIDDDLDFSFAARRFVAKLGARWTHGPLALGGTLSLPAVRLPGSSGSVSVGRTRMAQDAGGPVELAQTRQDGVAAEYRRPASVALGASLALGDVQLVTTTEWFGSVDRYEVLETRSFEAQRPVEILELPIAEGRESVFNAAVGASWNLIPSISFFASARTDRSYRDPVVDSFVGLGGFDLTHLTAGVGVVPDALSVWLGVMYASGEEERVYRSTPLEAASTVATIVEFERLGLVAAFSLDL